MKKNLSKRIISILSAICIAVCFIPVLGGVAYAGTDTKDIAPKTEPVCNTVGAVAEEGAIEEEVIDVSAAIEDAEDAVDKVGGYGDGIYVGGVEAYESGYIKSKYIKGKVYYDQYDNALYLEKATITVPSGDSGIVPLSSNELTIYLTGKNTIKGSAKGNSTTKVYDNIAGIIGTSDIDIESKTGKAATLTITLSKKSNTSYGIGCNNLVIGENATVNATAAPAYYSSIGVYATNIDVNWGTLNGKGNMGYDSNDRNKIPASCGILVGDNLSADGGTVKGVSGDSYQWDCHTIGLYVDGDVKTYDTKITGDSTASKLGETEYAYGIYVNGNFENYDGTVTAKAGNSYMGGAGLYFKGNMHNSSKMTLSCKDSTAVLRSSGSQMYWYDLFAIKTSNYSTGKKAYYWKGDYAYISDQPYIAFEPVNIKYDYEVVYNEDDAEYGLLYPWDYTAKIGKKWVACSDSVPYADQIGSYTMYLNEDVDYYNPTTIGTADMYYAVIPSGVCVYGVYGYGGGIEFYFDRANNKNEGNYEYQFRVSKKSNMKNAIYDYTDYPDYDSDDDLCWFDFDGLKTSTTYYCQMRTVGYSNGEFYYSPWSKKFKCKTTR